MNKCLLTSIILFIFCVNYSYAQENITALEIIKKADEKVRGKTNTSVMEMEIIRPTWKHSVTMKGWGR